MPQFRLLRPTDQPSGSNRLLGLLESAFKSDRYIRARFAVGFAKVGPPLRLERSTRAWRDRGNSIQAIVGFDHGGTSYQALQFMLEQFDEVRLVNAGGFSTYHPKVYLFDGPRMGWAGIGSHNLTLAAAGTDLLAVLRGAPNLPVTLAPLPPPDASCPHLHAPWRDTDRPPA